LTSDRRPCPRLLVAVDAAPGDGSVARALAAARRYGADGVLASPGAELPSAPLWALLPNMARYVRDASDAGLVGAAVRRVRAAGLGTIVRLARTGLGRAPLVLRRDFAGLLPLLLELEYAELGARELRGVVLAAPLTDLLLAATNAAFFRRHVAFVRRRFGVAAGFDTNNLGHLLERFARWDVAPDFVIGPVNARGHLMKPTPEAVLGALRATRIAVLARAVTAAGTVPVTDGIAYAESRGAAGAVLEAAELVDDGSR
jgi:hypothetical protein